MSKFLIYYIAIYKQYRPYLNFSINSLKRTDYNGKILVISDFRYKKKGVKNIVIKTEEALGLKLPGTILKTRISKYYNLKKYKFVIHLDSDVIVNNSQSLLKYLSEISTDKVYIQKHHRENMSSRWVSGFLSPEEKKKYMNFNPYCAGIFAVPINSFGLKFLDSWRNEIKKPEYPPRTNNDQAALNAIIFRKYKEQIEYINASFYRLRRTNIQEMNQLYEESIFVHFKRRKKFMKTYYLNITIKK